MVLIEGIVINKIQGFYNIKTEDNKEFLCKLRGLLKRKDKKENCTVGDHVVFDADGFITEVKERKNLLLRPLVANIDHIVIQFAAKDPLIDYERLNILLLNSFYYKIPPIIVVNKIDLLTEDEKEEIIKNLDFLKNIDIPYFMISTETGEGIEEIKNYIKDSITAFSGPSGVGKSSILNLLQSERVLATGETSKRLRAGKHTTRDSNLLPMKAGGYVIDTPGFSSVELPDIKTPAELMGLFPEFDLGIGCKFSNCIHINEPGCVVKEAVENNQISQKRYDFYKRCYDKLKNERWNRI
ncbi:MAG: ribosome small subunit-dependent GTPase A [Cetobacterium sp.]|uniref:Small ribosomal subunit biogenesis GTPase RsgA n=1 Tax=Cetobacterium ceti TaxID=180163 RepID=A0A1T4KK75_9FUSO|nr:ribosome small subunit-dependent GTPase A [Cetobacterium ceti]MCJ8342828.1 ribosome small subunit-dependent GTPase A [Cetobacterium sp.]SJZ42810.1 ribosome biogenesis GTPase [Cetobacterium ceti]